MNSKKEATSYKANGIVQANIEKCVEIIESSFLKDYFSDSLTDIQYNGDTFYAQDNEIGRFKLEIEMDNDDVLAIIKQIANYSLQPFSVQNPILDVSFGNYRLNAMHPSLARSKNEKVVTFSLRKISPTLKIKNDDPILCPHEVHELLKVLILNYQSIIISGLIGSGKTELQKYLVSKMNPADRIIIIEDSYETYLKELYPGRDITSWIVSQQQDNLNDLIKASLRNNPDWIIIAETRGQEAFELVQSIATGHPMITTIHSDSAKNSLHRLIKLFQKNIDFSEQNMLQDIAKNLKIGIHIEKRFENNKIVRFISEIIEYIPTKNGYSCNYLYQIKNNNERVYGTMSPFLLEKLKYNNEFFEDIAMFIKEETK